MGCPNTLQTFALANDPSSGYKWTPFAKTRLNRQKMKKVKKGCIFKSYGPRTECNLILDSIVNGVEEMRQSHKIVHALQISESVIYNYYSISTIRANTIFAHNLMIQKVKFQRKTPLPLRKECFIFQS